MIEVQEQLGLRIPVQIFASDINDRALKKARDAFYPDSIAMDVSPDRLRRYFTRVTDGYRVNATVREVCIFARHNMTTDPPFSRQDAISCRNVLIYLDATFQQNVIKLFTYALNSGGALVLGSSETPGQSEALEAIDAKQRIYTRTETSSRSHFEVSLSLLPVAIHPRVATTTPDSASSSIDRHVTRILIERFAPAGVLVNASLQILQFRGATGEFLEAAPGVASLNLFKMAKPGLDSELRHLMKKAQDSMQPCRNDAVVVRNGRNRRQISVEVIPVRIADEQPYFLVMFNKVTVTKPEKKGTGATVRPLPRIAAVQVLERELQNIKEHLQSIIREQEFTNGELQSANEEVLSGNEELQSINEELQTAKEELQSTNEELSTVNDELLNRNGELLLSTNDLTNLLASVNLPIVMVGEDLRIRRFTPAAERLFNLIESDVGRPITRVQPNLDLPQLDSLIRDAIETCRTTELEVRDHGGHWYSLRIRPYRTAENQVEGAVVILVDIGAIRITSEQLRESRGVNDTFFDTVSQPIMLLDADLRVVRVNDGFCRTFQIAKPAALGQQVFNLGDGAWSAPTFKALLGDVIPKTQQIADYHLTHNFPAVGVRHLVLNARPIQMDGATCVLLIIDDLTGTT